MKTSARNTFPATVTAIQTGAVNDEITLQLAGGDEVVALITRTSTQKLGLAPGKEAVVMIKAPMVVLMSDAGEYLLSTRNLFDATVTEVVAGAVNAEVTVRCNSGLELTAIITMRSLEAMGLKEGEKTTAMVKAPHIILAVKK